MSVPTAIFGPTVEVRSAVAFTAVCDKCGYRDAAWRQQYSVEGVRPSHFDVSCPACDPIVAAARMLRAGKTPEQVVDYLTGVAA